MAVGYRTFIGPRKSQDINLVGQAHIFFTPKILAGKRDRETGGSRARRRSWDVYGGCNSFFSRPKSTGEISEGGGSLVGFNPQDVSVGRKKFDKDRGKSTASRLSNRSERFNTDVPNDFRSSDSDKTEATERTLGFIWDFGRRDFFTHVRILTRQFRRKKLAHRRGRGGWCLCWVMMGWVKHDFVNRSSK